MAMPGGRGGRDSATICVVSLQKLFVLGEEGDCLGAAFCCFRVWYIG